MHEKGYRGKVKVETTVMNEQVNFEGSFFGKVGSTANVDFDNLSKSPLDQQKSKKAKLLLQNLLTKRAFFDDLTDLPDTQRIK